MALPDALRQRVLAFYDEGLKTRQIAANLRVSKSWCRRVKQFRGLPRPKNGGGRYKLDAAGCDCLRQFVAEHPDATLSELQQRILEELSIQISSGALWNTLRRLELTLKKKSLIASEQLRPDVAQARDVFFAEQLKDVPLKDVVVLDESYATTTFTRLRGRCPRNQRLKARVPGGHWKRLTIIAAITVQGMLCASTINASTDAEVFRSFVNEVLVPNLRPGMVVVMDNLSSHKVTGIRDAIEAIGCRLIYLPPYSPDLSPIEPTWSKVKQRLRSIAARDVATLHDAIGMALNEVTAKDCLGCFTDCGYTLHLK